MSINKRSLGKRSLGISGLEITTVGFGSWAVGGGGWLFGWGPQDDDQSIPAIQRAVAGGVNWIDTAAIYGLGHSEEVVARAVAGIPAAERPFIFTKCGLEFDPADHYKAPVQNAKPAFIRVEAMSEEDWRRRSDSHTEPALTRNLAMRDALRPIAARHETTVSAVAVAWVLAQPGVSGAIVGARTASQVDGWLPAGSLTLSPADLGEIAAAIERLEVGSQSIRLT